MNGFSLTFGLAVVTGGLMLCPCQTPNAQAATPSAAVAPADTTVVRFAIDGMTCGSCATTARIVLRRVTGVYDAAVSYDSATAVVSFDPTRTSPEALIDELRRMTGYEARLVEPETPANRTGSD